MPHCSLYSAINKQLHGYIHVNCQHARFLAIDPGNRLFIEI